MNKYKMIVKETYTHEIEVEAENGDDAVKKAHEVYENTNDGTFVVDGYNLEKVECFQKEVG